MTTIYKGTKAVVIYDNLKKWKDLRCILLQLTKLYFMTTKINCILLQPKSALYFSTTRIRLY